MCPFCAFYTFVYQNLRSDVFGSSKTPLIIQEVIDQGGEAIKGEEYLATGRITNFKFGLELGKVCTCTTFCTTIKNKK